VFISFHQYPHDVPLILHLDVQFCNISANIQSSKVFLYEFDP